MGSGLYGILILAVITVFVAGLMVGRTPEYLGKKINLHEMKLSSGYLHVEHRHHAAQAGVGVVGGINCAG
ncbi:potassium-transporting ATPase subunit KdpA [Mycobacterium tilburgii]|uniref:potassium-transporting ATPase subunit KdpA n=1 Tax=Mycobacterium tilburgii TaxID=44467 RepID=UPI00389912C5